MCRRGVEPPSSALQTDALPLSYLHESGPQWGTIHEPARLLPFSKPRSPRRRRCVPGTAPPGIEPRPGGSKPLVLPLHHGAIGSLGFEPRLSASEAGVLPLHHKPRIAVESNHAPLSATSLAGSGQPTSASLSKSGRRRSRTPTACTVHRFSRPGSPRPATSSSQAAEPRRLEPARLTDNQAGSSQHGGSIPWGQGFRSGRLQVEGLVCSHCTMPYRPTWESNPLLYVDSVVCWPVHQ